MFCGMDLNQLFHQPHIYAMFMGALAAARIDYVAFQAWKTPGEALAYDWKIAAWRVFQGALMGLIAANVVS